jgi:hypothetical protein
VTGDLERRVGTAAQAADAAEQRRDATAAALATESERVQALKQQESEVQVELDVARKEARRAQQGTVGR